MSRKRPRQCWCVSAWVSPWCTPWVGKGIILSYMASTLIYVNYVIRSCPFQSCQMGDDAMMRGSKVVAVYDRGAQYSEAILISFLISWTRSSAGIGGIFLAMAACAYHHDSLGRTQSPSLRGSFFPVIWPRLRPNVEQTSFFVWARPFATTWKSRGGIAIEAGSARGSSSDKSLPRCFAGRRLLTFDCLRSVAVWN